jgi:glutaredoxin
MRNAALLAVMLGVAGAPATAAQLYRWVDEKGNVEWRDTPPPPAAKKVEKRDVRGSAIETGTLPYSVQQAMKNFPVTLWVTDCGEPCDKARAHLNRRGVPYTEYNPQADIEAFRKASGGSMEVPVLLVGTQRLKGYRDSDWDAALDLAGYPKSPLAAVKPQPKAAPQPKPVAQARRAVTLYTSADCGPQCGEARQLLASRGVQYREVVVEGPEAAEELRKLSGDTFVPTLAAGRFVVRGFDPADYNRVLEQAGF